MTTQTFDSKTTFDTRAPNYPRSVIEFFAERVGQSLLDWLEPNAPDNVRRLFRANQWFAWRLQNDSDPDPDTTADNVSAAICALSELHGFED